jgi:hypothetical protein
MRRVLFTLILALGASVPAEARNQAISPPGNSGVAQYVESVPTATGGRPTSTIKPGDGSSHRSRGVGTSGGSGGSGSGGSGSGGLGSGGSGSDGNGGAIAPSVRRALAAQGPDGSAAAALAQATAAAAPGKAARPDGAEHRSALSAGSTRAGSSPLTALAKAATGSTSSGGLGPLLPAILTISLLGAGALALLRRRWTS